MVMNNNDDTFIREVNEELRSEQLQNAWKRFRPFIIGIAVLIVGVGAVLAPADRLERYMTNAGEAEALYRRAIAIDEANAKASPTGNPMADAMPGLGGTSTVGMPRAL